MMGRGQRARGNYSGIVFTTDQSQMQQSIETMIKKNSTFDFKDASVIIRVILDMKPVLEVKRPVMTWENFLKWGQKFWLGSYNDFVTHYDQATVRAEINKVYKTLKPYNKNDEI